MRSELDRTARYCRRVIKYLGSKRRLVPLIQQIVSELPVAIGVRPLRRHHAGRPGTSPDRPRGRLQRPGELLAGAGTGLHRRRRVRSIGLRFGGLLAELSALPPAPGYFTQTFCVDARFFTPQNGARIDAIRTAIDRYWRSATVERGLVLTSLLEAADRVDSTTGVQMAYLKSWAPRAPIDARAARARARCPAPRAPSLGATPTRSPRRSTSTWCTSTRPTTSTRTSRTTTSGRRWCAGIDPEAYGDRAQAGRLPHHQERVQLAPARPAALADLLDGGHGAVAARVALERGPSRSPTRCATARRARPRGRRRSGEQTLRRRPDRYPQPRGRAGGRRVAPATNSELLFLVGPDRAVIDRALDRSARADADMTLAGRDPAARARTTRTAATP